MSQAELSPISTKSEKALICSTESRHSLSQPEELTLTSKLQALLSLLHLAAGVSVASMAIVLTLRLSTIADVYCRAPAEDRCADSTANAMKLLLAANVLTIAAGLLNTAAGGMGWVMFAGRPNAWLTLSESLAGMFALTGGVAGVVVVVLKSRWAGSSSWQCETLNDAMDCEQFWAREGVVMGLLWLCVGIISLQTGCDVHRRRKDSTTKRGGGDEGKAT